jgi:uncharacterized protein (TIGR00725 family)
MPARSAPYVAVVGASNATEADIEDAESVGRELARRGAIVVCGGRGGVMAAVSRGAASAGGTVVGILPGLDRSDANEWLTVSIPTGFGELRNGLVVRAAEVMIAVGGAYGTLSEVALGLQSGLRVFGLHSWEIDGIEAVGTPAEAVQRALAALAPPL